MTSEAGVLVLPSMGDQPPGGHPGTSRPRNEMHMEMKLISLEEMFSASAQSTFTVKVRTA